MEATARKPDDGTENRPVPRQPCGARPLVRKGRPRPHIKNKIQKTANQKTVATMKPVPALKASSFILGSAI